MAPSKWPTTDQLHPGRDTADSDGTPEFSRIQWVMNGPRRKIYHITHVDNLPSIVRSDRLLSDAARLREGVGISEVGMTRIKQSRLHHREVQCHPGTHVGEYAAFYFCPRSVMLYLLHRGNHPDLDYRGGQRPIVHLELDLGQVIEWADNNGVRWAFTDVNAASRIARFYSRADDLQELDWDAIDARDWRLPDTKEHKQAEFLVYDSVPWPAVERIAVVHNDVKEQVEHALQGADHAPNVIVARGWYY